MFIFFDTETTSVKQDKLEVIQLAVKFDGDKNGFSEYFKPEGKIEIGAMAVHHITEKMVADKGTLTKEHSEDVSAFFKATANLDNVFIAHNAKFDINALTKYDIHITRYIDTLRLARYFDEESFFEAYNLQYLRYALGIEVDVDAHDAMGDVIVLEQIFNKIYSKAIKKWSGGAIDKMIEISMTPMLLRVMPFGKYKGKKCSEVPLDYWRWLYSSREQNKDNSAQDEDLDLTIETYLNY